MGFSRVLDQVMERIEEDFGTECHAQFTSFMAFAQVCHHMDGD